MKKVLVNGLPFKGAKINEPAAAIEIFRNLGNLQVYHPKEVIVHGNDQALAIHGDHISLQVKDNNCNICLYSDYAEITVEKNSGNLLFYGNHLSVNILENSSNLYAFGNHTQMLIEDGQGNIQLFGNHHSLEIKNGTAQSYGSYSITFAHPGAKTKHWGKPHETFRDVR